MTLLKSLKSSLDMLDETLSKLPYTEDSSLPPSEQEKIYMALVAIEEANNQLKSLNRP